MTLLLLQMAGRCGSCLALLMGQWTSESLSRWLAMHHGVQQRCLSDGVRYVMLCYIILCYVCGEGLDVQVASSTAPGGG